MSHPWYQGQISEKNNSQLLKTNHISLCLHKKDLIDSPLFKLLILSINK